ncbi:hypothetical protein PghCCS26_46140 [Paenibacillus glycanilyticus]|uniref:Uncharacterized protein n=1 Tax=Paenibacillus glycanilyticus TaxID=126569 RepID=A0ABQ6NRU0_9BACL|nr:hypothetical protein [Paenibacillus glycanilyticus]GMK47484.1 hypothetical protein PghCCS26_46140 [Paenibacillus glycanilyticus]
MGKFTIKSFAPYSLNYLIYIQNAFISSKNEVPKFPSHETAHWGLLEEEHFRESYKNVWVEMVRRLSQNSLTDHNGILVTEQTLFRNLFKAGEQGEKGFEESRKSFYAWFSSLTGQLTIEKAADHIMYYEIDIYNKVSSTIYHHDDRTNQELLISLIYDECLFGVSTGYSWHSIVSLKDIFLDRKDLVSIITERWNEGKT